MALRQDRARAFASLESAGQFGHSIVEADNITMAVRMIIVLIGERRRQPIPAVPEVSQFGKHPLTLPRRQHHASVPIACSGHGIAGSVIWILLSCDPPGWRAEDRSWTQTCVTWVSTGHSPRLACVIRADRNCRRPRCSRDTTVATGVFMMLAISL
jgi:hypothetical protein